MKPETDEVQLRRKKYSMIFAILWTSLPTENLEDYQMEIGRILKPDSTLNWVIDKLGHLPKFPTENKGAMEQESMEILTAFRVDPGDELTLEEAKADPYETLVSMVDTIAGSMDLLAGERA